MSSVIKIVSETVTDAFPAPVELTRLQRMDYAGQTDNFVGMENFYPSKQGMRATEPLLDYLYFADANELPTMSGGPFKPDIWSDGKAKSWADFYPYKPIGLLNMPGSNSVCIPFLFASNRTSNGSESGVWLRIYLCLFNQSDGLPKNPLWSRYANSFTDNGALKTSTATWIKIGLDESVVDAIESIYERLAVSGQQMSISCTAISGSRTYQGKDPLNINFFRMFIWDKGFANRYQLFGSYGIDSTGNIAWVAQGNFAASSYLPEFTYSTQGTSCNNAFMLSSQPNTEELLIANCYSTVDSNFIMYRSSDGRTLMSPPSGGGVMPNNSLQSDGLFSASNLGTLPPTTKQFVSNSMAWTTTILPSSAYALCVNGNFLYLFDSLGIERFQIKTVEDQNKSGNVRLDLSKDTNFFMDYIIQPGSKPLAFKTFIAFVSTVGNLIIVDMSGAEKRLDNVIFHGDINLFGWVSSTGEEYIVCNDLAFSVSTEHSFKLEYAMSGMVKSAVGVCSEVNGTDFGNDLDGNTYYYNIAPVYSHSVFYNTGNFSTVITRFQEFSARTMSDPTDECCFLVNYKIPDEQISPINLDNSKTTVSELAIYNSYVGKSALPKVPIKVWDLDRYTYFYRERVDNLTCRYWAPSAYFVFNKALLDESLASNDKNNSVISDLAFLSAAKAGMTSALLRSDTGNVVKVSSVTISIDWSTFINPSFSFLEIGGKMDNNLSLWVGATEKLVFDLNDFWQPVGKAFISVEKKQFESRFASTPSVVSFMQQFSGYAIQMKWEIAPTIDYNLLIKPFMATLKIPKPAKTGLFNWYLLGVLSVSYG